MYVLTSSIKIHTTGISRNERSEKKYMDYPKKHESMVLEPTIGTIDYHEAIVSALNCHRTLLDGALAQLAAQTTVFTEAAAGLIETLRSGHKVLVAGNGGSAAEAQRCLMTVIAVTGDRPNRLECMADPAIRVPGVDTAIIQELHMVVTHILCDLVESELAACERGAGR